MAIDFGKLNFAVGFNRTSAFPLDANSYFENYDLAVQAAQGAAEVGSSDSAYYIGQLLILNDKTPTSESYTNKGIGLYQITAAKTLIKFGQASSADELGERVSALEGQVTTINGKLVLATESTDGLMPKETVAKIAGIEAGAQANVIEAIKVGSVSLPVGKDKSVDLGDYLTGAMHFVGVSTTDPAGESGPSIQDRTLFASGDLCLYEKKEFVFDGSKWIELGDEGSYLTKTEAGSTYLSKGDAKATYVAKEVGKELVDTTLVNKLSGLAEIKSIGTGLALADETKELTVDSDAIATIVSQSTAKNVANELTIGTKKFDGSQAVTVTAADIGALTAITQATDSALGGIKIGYNETDEKRAIKLDGNGKGYVDIPPALFKSVNPTNFKISEETKELSINQVSTDALVQGEQILILSGGSSAD